MSKVENFTLQMKDNTLIYGDVYYPESSESPKGIIEVVHGMSEHRKRYKEFADFLTKNNYIVYCYDQRGHGETAGSVENLGYMSDIDNFAILVEDAKNVCDYITQINQDKNLPIFLLGHSMGSFVTQRFIELYPSKINGAILVGTNYLKSPLFKIGKFLAKIIVKCKGRKYQSKFINNMSFGSYNKAFKPNRTDFDWLNTRDEEVDKYIKDEYCGTIFSASYFMDLLNGFHDVMEGIDLIRPDLPILLLSGTADPVGENGKGPEKLTKTYLAKSIKDVTLKLYEGKRHEILNEDIRYDVYDDLLNWINAHLK